MNDGGEGLWVFGYGSLMWRPGFDHGEVRTARVHGYHRAPCVLSVVHRGTPEQPGLVLGLDIGGSCIGRAFRVTAADAAATVTYLDEREMVTAVYRPKTLAARLDDGRRVPVHAYIVDRAHDQYAGRLAVEKAARLLAFGHGRSGWGVEYLRNTVRHMEALGIDDRRLGDILARAETLARGSGRN